MGEERATRADWCDALGLLEAAHGVGVCVHDADTREVTREAEADAVYHLLRYDDEFRLLGDASAWRDMGREHRCPNPDCGYRTTHLGHLKQHVASAACATCKTCGKAFESVDALVQHRADASVAPCAPPLARPCIQTHLLPRHHRYRMEWDIETRPDANNDSRTTLICAKLNTALATLMEGHELPMQRCVKDADGRFVVAAEDTSSPHLATRCVTHDDLTAVSRAVFEQFLALLDGIEGALAMQQRWHYAAAFCAVHYLLGEWHAVTAPDAAEEQDEVCTECECVDDAASVDEGDAMAAAEARLARDDADAEAAAAARASASTDATTRAQGKYATWYARTSAARRTMHFETRVLPALGDLDLKRAIEHTVDSNASAAMPQVARAVWDAMLGVLPADVRGYVATRMGTYGKWFGKKYRAMRAKHQVHLLAHNSASFDSCALLDHFIATGRLGVERSAFVHDVLTDGAAAHDQLLAVLGGDGTTMVDTGGSRFIDVKYRGMFVFRDSFKQLARSLAALGASFKVETLKGAFPHAHLRRASARYADEEALYKPSRLDYVVLAKAPHKHARKALLSEAEYAKVHGRDPDGELHGPPGTTFNIHRENVSYCMDDVESLSQIWEQWTKAVVSVTSDDGGDIAHAALATGATATIVCVDPGPSNSGVCALHVEADGTRRVLRWDLLHDNARIGAQLRNYVAVIEQRGHRVDAIVVEQPPVVEGRLNSATFGVVERIVAEFEGWVVGRLAPSTQDDANFSVLYVDAWVEQQTLTMDAYGGEGYGAWVLLEGTLPAIEGYERGSYLVGGKWKRAPALLYTAAELKSARETHKARRYEETDAACEDELDTGGLTFGQRVLVHALAPTGRHAWFKAIVLRLRRKFPPVQVKFLATRAGETNRLALPVPRKAYVASTDVQPE